MDESRMVTIYPAKSILTMEDSFPQAKAVAVRGERIIAVGSMSEVQASLGETEYVIDEKFASLVMVPGLIDQHLHPILGASTLASEVIAPEEWVMPTRTFPAANSQDEYRERLRQANASLTDDSEWLFSWGYHKLWHGALDRETLDAISAERPIVIWQRSCHEWYMNTAAIDALGFTEEGMQGNGPASDMMSWEDGHWWEQGMNLIVEAVSGAIFTPTRLMFGLQQMVDYLHINGVTAYNEPGAFEIVGTPGIWQLYQAILGGDKTPMYSYFLVDGRVQFDSGLDPADSLADTEQQVALAPSGKVSFFPKQIKLYADGAIISQLMQMKDPYLDAEGNPDPSHHGEWLMEPQNLEERIKLYWDADYQIHVHVNGDLALGVLLDILERRMVENPRTDHRTTIVHFANSTEEEIDRIARLGCIVSGNPYYTTAFADMYAKFGLGPERADSMVRSASVLARKIPLSFHSDLPMGPSSPLNFMWCAVNRTTPSGRVAGADQCISVHDALRAVTIEAAYSWRKEDEIGSIAPGKIANFTLLTESPYDVDPLDLRNIGIIGTVFEGAWFPSPAGENTRGTLRQVD